MAKKQRSRKGKGSYASYQLKGMHLKNKIKRMEKTLRTQPENLELAGRLEDIKKNGLTISQRSRPVSRHWTPGRITFARILSQTGLNGHMALVPTPLHGGDATAQKSREDYKARWVEAHRIRDTKKPGLFSN